MRANIPTFRGVASKPLRWRATKLVVAPSGNQRNKLPRVQEQSKLKSTSAKTPKNVKKFPINA